MREMETGRNAAHGDEGWRSASWTVGGGLLMTEGRSLMVDGSENPPEPGFPAGRSGMGKRLRGGARRRNVAGGQAKAAARPACAAREATDDRGKRKAGEAGFGSESRRAGDGLTQRGGDEAFGCVAGGRTGAEYGARLGLRSGACATAGSGR